MTTTHDLTTQRFKGRPVKSGINGRQIISVRLLGSDLTSPINGVTPENGDAYKIAKFGKHQMAIDGNTCVVNADDTSITLAIGYTDNTNYDVDAFEASVNLNSATITKSMDIPTLFDDDGYYLLLTPSTLTGLGDATEFVITIEVLDLSRAGITTALTDTIPA